MERWGGSEESNTSTQDRARLLFQQFPHTRNFHMQSLFTQHSDKTSVPEGTKALPRYIRSKQAASMPGDRPPGHISIKRADAMVICTLLSRLGIFWEKKRLWCESIVNCKESGMCIICGESTCSTSALTEKCTFIIFH